MRKFIAGLLMICALCATLTGCAGFRRSMKSFGSDLTGGLDRTVSVYDYNGGLIKSWSGKFDVSESESETFFDVDGKRVIIQGGIIINEEN